LELGLAAGSIGVALAVFGATGGDWLGGDLLSLRTGASSGSSVAAKFAHRLVFVEVLFNSFFAAAANFSLSRDLIARNFAVGRFPSVLSKMPSGFADLEGL